MPARARHSTESPAVAPKPLRIGHGGLAVSHCWSRFRTRPNLLTRLGESSGAPRISSARGVEVTVRAAPGTTIVPVGEAREIVVNSWVNFAG